MNNFGAIRRIDELGRIVIPKDLRKKLNIYDGEDLEINIVDELITIKKYSCLSNIESRLNKLINSIYNYFGIKCIITDREKIIASSYNCTNQRIDEEIIKKIFERDKYVSNERINIRITSELSVEGFVCYVPIISESSEVGLLILIADANYAFISNLSLFISEIITIFFELS